MASSEPTAEPFSSASDPKAIKVLPPVYSETPLKTISSCLMPRDQRLSGLKNWNTWFSTLELFLEILDIKRYFDKKEAYTLYLNEIKL